MSWKKPKEKGRYANMRSLLVTAHFGENASYPVGKLFLSELTGKCHFDYDPSFAGRGIELSPLLFPVRGRSYEAPQNDDFYNLHGVFADSLPDDWGRKVQDLEFNEPTAIDRLAFVGRYGIGALRYEPAREFEEGDDIVTLADLRKATQRILEGSYEEVTDKLLKSGGSAGGMRPKFLVDLECKNQDRIRYTRGVPEGNYYPVIIKTPSKDGDHFQRIEYCYSKMAKQCGMDIPETFLLSGIKSKKAFFAIKRFDVLEDGGRLHVHTYAGLSGLNFRQANPDYSDLFRTIYDVTRDHGQVVEAYRRMAFNYIGYNNDDHAKNFSFVMVGNGRWSLSPAYDVGYSTGQQGYHSMAMNGVRHNARVKDFEKMAENFNVKEWKGIIAKTCACLKEWKTIARSNGVPEKFRAIVNHRIMENINRIGKDLPPGGA
jgi:serine/threonine-protein kinase HipA